MIVGGILIISALIVYCIHKPKRSPKGSLGYYKKEWKTIL